ncbi:threonine aldolase family protein [Leisingera sp. NJS204]|uniref:threonine aldolase family protein n=1 Tax=Leisingera sp. NJS204 TaxID=2508307 RepID=UPI0010120D27|nr:beta-eliminating lyase-related protein [Leisingera sp. NJS204]QAX28942.1 low specificity L-threonine aldolase [Leisingera sp. NJS204]
MHFASDNSGPAPQQILDALAKANQGYAMGYGADAEMAEVTAKIRAVFEAPEASVYLVATGTAANVLALSTLAQPWQTVFCTRPAHILQDECNGPEFYTGGAKLTPVTDADKMTPETLRAAIEGEEVRGVHGPQRGPVSLSQVTEFGTVYSVAEIEALGAVAREYALPVHMDGARFTNALIPLGCTPAEMTWKTGVTALSFGGTKNGCLGVEAVIFFDPGHAQEFEYRRKRGAHLFSKHRYLSAQMLAYLTNDLWLDNARTANSNCAMLAEGLQAAGARFTHPAQANMIFAALPRSTHQRLFAAGAIYHLWDGLLQGPENELVTARFVCDWSLTEEQISAFLNLL